MCGIFETDDIKFNERAGDTLLEILELVFPNENDILDKLNDERVSYFIRLDKATGISSHFFSSHNILSDRDLEKCLVTLNSVAKTTKRLPNSARIDAIDRGNMDELFVNVDEVVEHNDVSVV